MPLTHFACPSTVPTYGEMHTPEYCVSECPHKCMSPFLITAIANATFSNHHQNKYVSATALDGCVRKLKLERTVDYADELNKLWYSFRGTLIHEVIEKAAEAKIFNGKTLVDLGYLSEWRMQIGFCFKHNAFQLPEGVVATDESTWGDVHCPKCKKERRPKKDRHFIILGGTLDGMTPYWDGFVPATTDEVGPNGEGILEVDLEDLKTMQEYAIGKMITGDSDAKLHAKANDLEIGHVKDSHVRQANVYRYMAVRSRPPESLWEKGVRQLKFRESRIQGFAMGSAPYTGTYQRYRKHWKHEYTDWYIPNIQFFDEEWVEEYIRESAWPIYQALILDNERGDVCGEEDQWLCDGFCAFSGTEYCPNPKVERKALKEGKTKEEAFSLALATITIDG